MDDGAGGRRDFPKVLAQFEAWAFHNGPDGKPDSPDDIDLGIVDASWTLEEYTATYDDDDMKFVGTIDGKTGRFTPNIDGPESEPQRGAATTSATSMSSPPTRRMRRTPRRPSRCVRAAHLLVTVPLYMRWEPTERAAK